jgi:hypothetical protein
VISNLPLEIDVPRIILSDFTTDDLINFTVGGLRVEEPLIVARHNSKELLKLKAITVEKILVGEGGSINIESTGVEKLVFLGPDEESKEVAGIELGEARLTGISWSSKDGFAGDNLEFSDLVTSVVRGEEGNINLTDRLNAMKAVTESKEDVQPVESSEDEAGATPLRLGQVSISGDSRLQFEDYTLAVPYKTHLAIREFTLGELDSTQPDLETPIMLNAKLEERAPVQLTGHISPFKEKLAINMKLKVKNYPLSSLSAYTVQSVGTALASGQLKLKTKMILADDYLKMDNNVILKKLKTETISEELAAELNNQLPISLDTALSILRDKNDNIDLDIPLNGPVSDLNVGVADVLITALSKAIVPAASGYLMYTLGPYGALAYVGMKVGESITKVSFPPVEFVAGETVLGDEQKKYLEKMGEILTDRPETDLQLCPQVASWEFMGEKKRAKVEGSQIAIEEKEREKLVELGQQRAGVVRAHLVETYGVDEDRLLICDTAIETAKDVVPSVLIQL